VIHDVIIVGGSYAGLSAGLQLARARRKLLVIDAGMRRNRFAEASHGFLGQDGVDPGVIAAQAKQQLLAYPSVDWHSGTASAVLEEQGLFAVSTQEGETFRARRLILAGGVSDELPAIPGLVERWGRQVFHCPYCHAYELDGGAIGVLASSPLAMHQALMLPDWGPTTLFLNGAFEPDAEQLQKLRSRQVALEHERILSLDGEPLQIRLADGRSLQLAGLFAQPRTHLRSPLAKQLGCVLEQGPTGEFIRIDSMTRETSVAGVFACGDAALPAGNVAISVGEGARTGSAVHQSLIFR